MEEMYQKKESWTKHLGTVLTIIVGNIILAFGIMTFVVPAGFIAGGATGISLLVNHLTGLPLETGVSILNVVMFIVGLIFLGKKFAATTLLSTVIYPTALGVFRRIPELATINNDLMIAAIFGGALIGMGVGLVVREGASTGGMDIPPIIINRRTGFPVAYLLNAFDVVILCAQLPYSTPQQVLYSLVVVVSTTMVMNKVVLLGVSQTQVMIISSKYEEINTAIQEQVSRGTTFLEAVSGHLRQPQKVVMSVVSNRQLKELTDLVNRIDPRAFLVINKVNEVRGNGFTMFLEDRSFKKAKKGK